MRDFMKIACIIFVSLFVIIIGYLMFGSSGGITYDEYLSQNTSYDWEFVEGYKCIGAYDEMLVLETVENDFRLTIYFNNDEISNIDLIQNEDSCENMDMLIDEIEEALDVTFWYQW